MKNVTPPDTLHTCPKCGTGGFINLKSHICKGPKPAAGAVAKVDPGAAFSVARDYHAKAMAFGAASVAHMVMCGVELARIKDAMGQTQGTRNDLSTSSHDETKLGFDALCSEHLGIKRPTAYRYLMMARNCGKKVKQLQRLLAADPSTVTDADRKKVFAIVLKAVDGCHASEILTEWGLGKKKPLAIAGGDEPDEEQSDEEAQEEFLRKTAKDKALADWTELAANLRAYGLKSRSFLHLPGEARQNLRGILTELLKLLTETTGD